MTDLLQPSTGTRGTCIVSDPDADLPRHVDPCECPTHDGVCRRCGNHITIGSERTEYGHVKGYRSSRLDEDCPHRPASVDPGNSRIVTDGGVDRITVCPECDSSQVHPNVQSDLHRARAETAYHCGDCGARFDEPRERDRLHEGGRRGLAGQLDRADPDDLVTDGGQELAFEVTFSCENCGDEWTDQFPSRTVIDEDSRVQTFDKDCGQLGTQKCDCCNVVWCPLCELANYVTVDGREPLAGGESDD